MLDKGNGPKSPLRAYTAGFEFIFIFGLFVAGGFLLDYYVFKPPGFTVLGMIVGFSAGLYWLLRRVKEARHDFDNLKKNAKTDQQEKPEDTLDE